MCIELVELEVKWSETCFMRLISVFLPCDTDPLSLLPRTKHTPAPLTCIRDLRILHTLTINLTAHTQTGTKKTPCMHIMKLCMPSQTHR